MRWELQLLGRRGRKAAALTLTLSLLNQQGLLVSEALGQVVASRVAAAPVTAPVVPVVPAAPALSGPVLSPLSVSPLSLTPALTVPSVVLPSAAGAPAAAAAAPRTGAAAALALPVSVGVKAAAATLGFPLSAADAAPAGAEQTDSPHRAWDGASQGIQSLVNSQSRPQQSTKQKLGVLTEKLAAPEKADAPGTLRAAFDDGALHGGPSGVAAGWAAWGLSRPLAAVLGVSEPEGREPVPAASDRIESPAAETDPSERPARVWTAVLTWPLREARFLAKTFASAFTRPTLSEFVGGAVTKTPPFIANVVTWWVAIGPSHPVLLSMAIALSLALETFHGVFLNTWNNFQDGIYKQRSGSYQITFNWLYMQATGAMFRTLAWAADATGKVVPVWSWRYWKDLGIMSLAGTFFGSLGYRGLNALHQKYRLKRWQRSAIQQVRDLFMLIAGPFFAAGAMEVFWMIFLVQQGLDLAIFIAGIMATQREVTPEEAASEKFRKDYPAPSTEPELSVGQQAVKALLDNPFVWPFTALYRLGRWLYRRAAGAW